MRQQILAAEGQTIRPVLGRDLRVLFCGINPGLYSGATGHHFARPGNRFWPALCAAGFTPRPITAFEDSLLPQWGCGITNLVARATAAADELTDAELRAGSRRLMRIVRRYRPMWVAVLGIGAYRTAFGRPQAQLGPQEQDIAGARLWILPNPSGLNAHYSLAELTCQFRRLYEASR